MKRALEEKKLAREEARNAERLAMQAFHEKTALVEVFSKVFCQRLGLFLSPLYLHFSLFGLGKVILYHHTYMQIFY